MNDRGSCVCSFGRVYGRFFGAPSVALLFNRSLWSHIYPFVQYDLKKCHIKYLLRGKKEGVSSADE